MFVAFNTDIKTETILGVIHICVERGRLFGIIRIREWIHVGEGGGARRAAVLRRGLYVTRSSQGEVPQGNVICVSQEHLTRVWIPICSRRAAGSFTLRHHA